MKEDRRRGSLGVKSASGRRRRVRVRAEGAGERGRTEIGRTSGELRRVGERDVLSTTQREHASAVEEAGWR